MLDRETRDEIRAAVKEAFGGELKSVVKKAVDDAVNESMKDAVRVVVSDIVNGKIDEAARKSNDAVRVVVNDIVNGKIDEAVRKSNDSLRVVVNDIVNDAVREIRAGQRWGIGITLAVILGVLSIGTPLVVGRITAELRASTAEAEADHVEEITRYDERLKAVEKAVE